MRILYRQSTNCEKEEGLLSRYGINKCYFKSIKQSAGDGCDVKKRHSHTGFEFHIMIDGKQCYETDGGIFELDSGKIFAVPRGVPHSLLSCSHFFKKYAFTFLLSDEFFDSKSVSECILINAPERILSNIREVEALDKEMGLREVLIENIVFETVCLLLRELGIDVKIADYGCQNLAESKKMDERVELAILFIKDNVETPLQVGEVASYCYISEKQLNRLFMADMEISVADYIRRVRMQKLEELLTETNISLSQISERYGFPTEHGFNVFFKKYNGMPPGEYRKMTKNGKD